MAIGGRIGILHMGQMGAKASPDLVVQACEDVVMNEPDEPLQTAASAVAEFAGRPTYALSNEELRSSLGGLHRLATLVAGAAAALAHEACGRDLPHDDGAASAVAWLRDLLRISPAEASRMVAMGADHRPEFIPPAYLDPQRRPRRNPYHPRP